MPMVANDSYIFSVNLISAKGENDLKAKNERNLEVYFVSVSSERQKINFHSRGRSRKGRYVRVEYVKGFQLTGFFFSNLKRCIK